MRAPLHASETFYEDTTDIGTMIAIECDEHKFRLITLNWGAPEDYERSSDGEVELRWTVSEEAFAKLMKTCHNAKTPDDVIAYLYERFGSFGRQARTEMLRWFNKKEIIYTFSIY